MRHVDYLTLTVPLPQATRSLARAASLRQHRHLIAIHSRLSTPAVVQYTLNTIDSLLVCSVQRNTKAASPRRILPPQCLAASFEPRNIVCPLPSFPSPRHYCYLTRSRQGHVFGRPTKKEQCYDNLRISSNAWDTNLIKVNPKYLSVNWQASGGGAFAIIPLEERGREPEVLPLFRGHTAAVLDTDFSPFNDDIVASASDDGKVFLWKVPENFSLHSDQDEPTDVSPVGKLSGHSR